MQGIDALLAKFKDAELKSTSIKESCLSAVNKSVPGALLPEDFELSPTGILRLGPNVGSSARAEISLYKKVILAELAATLGKSAPHDIR